MLIEVRTQRSYRVMKFEQTGTGRQLLALQCIIKDIISVDNFKKCRQFTPSDSDGLNVILGSLLISKFPKVMISRIVLTSFGICRATRVECDKFCESREKKFEKEMDAPEIGNWEQNYDQFLFDESTGTDWKLQQHIKFDFSHLESNRDLCCTTIHWLHEVEFEKYGN